MSIQSQIQDILDNIGVALVDNSGGSATGTLADGNDAVTGIDVTTTGTAADASDVNARLVTIANSIASLASKQALIITAIDKIAAQAVFK